MEFSEHFHYVIKYQKVKSNIIVDALSCSHTLFSKMGVQILGYEHMSELYRQDSKISYIFYGCQQKPQGGFCVTNGYLFKEGKVYIP